MRAPSGARAPRARRASGACEQRSRTDSARSSASASARASPRGSRPRARGWCRAQRRGRGRRRGLGLRASHRELRGAGRRARARAARRAAAASRDAVSSRSDRGSRASRSSVSVWSTPRPSVATASNTARRAGRACGAAPRARRGRTRSRLLYWITSGTSLESAPVGGERRRAAPRSSRGSRRAARAARPTTNTTPSTRSSSCLRVGACSGPPGTATQLDARAHAARPRRARSAARGR